MGEGSPSFEEIGSSRVSDVQDENGEKATASKGDIYSFALKNKGTIAPGTYAIVANVGNRKVLDVSGGSSSNEANVRLCASNATEAQRWRVLEDEQGFLTITSVKSGKVLDVASGAKKAGTNVQQWESNGTLAQKWIAVAGVDGDVTLHSALDENLVLDVSG